MHRDSSSVSHTRSRHNRPFHSSMVVFVVMLATVVKTTLFIDNSSSKHYISTHSDRMRRLLLILLLIPCQTFAVVLPEYNLRVTFEGSTTTLRVKADESILSALERNNIGNKLSLDLPSDCRRGNCLTCSARHMDDSQIHSLTGDDGLSPAVGAELRKRRYALTCSSFLKGEGVHLDLGKNTDAWTDVYRSRLEDSDIQNVARAAMAKTIRKYAEQRVDEFIQETEKIYRNST